MQTVTLLFIVTLGLLNALQKPIQIAAIFDHDANMRHDLMFVNAVKSVNRLPGLLRGVTLVPVIQKIPPDNSFIAERAACQVLSKGVAAVLGPQSRHNSEHIKSLCDNSEVPYIETLSPGSSTPGPGPRYTSINLHPDPGQLGHVLVSLVKRYGWSKVALLYEDNRSLVSLQALLDLTATSEGRLQLVTRQLIVDRVEGYRTVLRELSDTGARHIVLACSKEILWDVLNQAQQIGLVTQQVNWILTNLDAHTVDFRPFKYDFTNFTLLRIVDFSRPFVQYSLHSIVREEIMMGRTLDFTEFSGGLDTEAALIYDAVHLFAVALSQVRQVQDLQPASIHCERLNDRPEEDDRDPGHKQFWQHGSTIINFMRLSTIPGLSGTVKFDSWGRRSEFSLDLLNLFEEQGLARVGGWEIEGGVTLSGLPVEGAGGNEPQNPMMNKSLVVTTILNPPYTMIKEESGVLFGNDRYEGFIPEMVDIMSKILQFNVSLRIVADGQYGGFDGSRWNGMMREVLVGEADMAVADLSITTKRADAVEFSMPWMNLGISIIYMKPKKAPPGLLMFLEPFGIDVWIATLISILLVAMFTFVIGRFSPYEWFNPNFCIMAPDELETQWNLNNSLWHTVGALMQQGTDFCPVSLSARFLVGIFYFFTLILLSSYTANLAASLTAETLNRPITSAEDLAEQTQIKYGVVFCGSTCSFFRDSSYETYMKMWSFMSSPENLDKVMVKSNAEGVEKVQQEQGGFAFMMESAGIQYIVERNCELAQVGGNLDTKGYGIATRPGSGFKTLLDQAILMMQENGDLHRLKNKWWKQKRGGGRCATIKAKGAEELGLDNLGGIFVVTFSGVAFACLACLAELLYVTYQDSEELGTSWWYELRSRTSFAFRCTAFGRKERMPAVRGMRRSSESEVGDSKGESSSEEETSMSRPKRNSWHLHYPGW